MAGDDPPAPKRARLEAPGSDDDDDGARQGPPPTGAAGRAARATRAVLRLSAGGLFGLGPSAETRARAFAQELAALRGVYTKVGQVVASFLTAAGTEPGTLRHALAEELARLQHRVLPMDPAALVAEMARAWGVPSVLDVLEAPPEVLAAASIGQVFRGRLRAGGRAVAIKVQYPGIAQAMRDDLGAIEGLLGVVTRALSFRVSAAAVAREIRLLIGGETDYALECRVQRAFHDFWAGHPGVAVPEPIEALCGDTVIVQALGEGQPFPRFVQDHANDPAARQRAACHLLEFFNESRTVLGLFHADPHPGNVLVRGDGGVTVLDFGCVRGSPVPSRDLGRRTLMHALHDGRQALSAEFAAHPAFRNQPARTVEATLDTLWPVFQVHAEPFDPRAGAVPAGGSVFSADWLQRCHASMSPGRMAGVAGPTDMLFEHRLTHGLNCMLVELSPPGDRAFWSGATQRYTAPDCLVPPTHTGAGLRPYPPPHAACAPAEAEAFGLDITARYALGQRLRAAIGDGYGDAAP